ncbi:hypothetical protein [uncultured Aquimarina sp.]|uniref:tetratricopeptide repeat protein n=1 Tax=uncultured Aquimarina sp. TaxID=575652 RepID=UPI0026123096|nr:hypothetical protein [uncultured Aquimarina sp.]
MNISQKRDSISFTLFIKLAHIAPKFLVFIFCNVLLGQNAEAIIIHPDLDSLHYIHYGGVSDKDYIVHHKLIKESSKRSYIKGILRAYKSLLWYHGAKPRNANLDSVLYYADLFETKTKNNRNNIALVNSLDLPNYYLNKGQILAHGFGLPEQALEGYFKAYPLITKEDKELLIKYNIAISQIYFYKFQYDKALEVLNPIITDTAGLKTDTKIQLLRNIAENYVSKKMPEKSYLLHKEILALSKKDNDTGNIWWTKNQLANDYFRLGQHQKAIDSALVVRNYCIENGFHELLYNNSAYLSTYYHAIGNIDEAIIYRKKAMELSAGLEFKIDTYKKLSGYYIEKKQYLDAIDFYEKRNIAVDSLRSTEKKTLTNYIDSNVKLLKEKQKSQQILFDIQLLEVKNKKQKFYLFSISIGLISIILLLGSILLFKKYRKGEKAIEILKSNEKKLLEEKIAFRENELEASAIALSQRLEILNVVKNELNEIKHPKIPKLEDIKHKINNLINSASDVSIITKKIESEYPTISSILINKYPSLSETQMRYCLLTKLNLSIKETSIILNVTPDTVKVARSRLKKKLEIPADMTFKMFLDNLSKEEK